MCLLRDNALSRVTPRILMSEKTGTVQPATSILVREGRVCDHCQVPKMIASDLSGLRARPLRQNQVWRQERHCSSFWTLNDRVDLVTVTYSCVSSMYCCWERPCTIAVRSSDSIRPSFLLSSPSTLIWPAIWLTQCQMALKPDGYVWHRIMNNIHVYEFVVYQWPTKNFLVVHKFESNRVYGLGRPPAQRCCHLMRWTRDLPSSPHKSVMNELSDKSISTHNKEK